MEKYVSYRLVDFEHFLFVCCSPFLFSRASVRLLRTTDNEDFLFNVEETKKLFLRIAGIIIISCHNGMANNVTKTQQIHKSTEQ